MVELSNQGFTASFRTFDGQWKGEILEYLSLQTIRRDHQLSTNSCPLKLPLIHRFVQKGVVIKIISPPPLLKWISFYSYILSARPCIVENFSAPPLPTSFYIFLLHFLHLMARFVGPHRNSPRFTRRLLSFSLFISFQFCPTSVFKALPWFAPRAALQPTPWPRWENRSASPPATATAYWGSPRQ